MSGLGLVKAFLYMGSASQDSSHVGDAGVGVVSLRGAPLALPAFCYCSV